MKSRYLPQFGFLFLWILLLSACKSIGPRTIPADSFNYNDRIAQHQQEQLLLNIVRLRYGEAPLFLNVNSMINSYTRQGNAGIGTSFGDGSGTQAANIGGSWSDKPTITYSPMSGAAYSNSLLTPLPPAAVFFLVQSGWSVNSAIRGTTNTINGHVNSAAAPRRRHESSTEFDSLLTSIQRIQRANSLGLKLDPRDDGTHTVDLFFPENPPNEDVAKDIATVKRLLQVSPDLNSFPLTYGLIRESNETVILQTRSILEILTDLSYHIDVPEEHLTRGLTEATFIPKDDADFNIYSSKNKPENAMVSIYTRGYWFYIDDGDLPSKNTFSFIQIVMSLTKGGQSAVSPLISIGN